MIADSGQYKLWRLFIAVHVTGDFKIEGRETLQLLGRAQDPHAIQSQILEDLRADPVGAQHAGAGGRDFCQLSGRVR